MKSYITTLFLTLVVFMAEARSIDTDDDLARWRPGLSKGVLIPDSTSPDGKFSLFEIPYNWKFPDRPGIGIGEGEGGASHSAIVVADSQKTVPFGLIFTRWLTISDDSYKEFLASISWSPDSKYLAISAPISKQTSLRLYHFKSEKPTPVALPDLVGPALIKVSSNLTASDRLTDLAQSPLRWIANNKLLVGVSLTMGNAVSETSFVLSISSNDSASIESEKKVKDSFSK
jgi:hypothetical protein